MPGFPFFKRSDDFRVQPPNFEVEPQEVLLDTFALRYQEEQGDGAPTLELPLSQSLFQKIIWAFLLLIFLFVGRVAQLQVLAGADLREKAANNTFRITPSFGGRGIIYDSFMKPLVFNVASFDLVCDKRDFPKDRHKKELILEEISLALNIPFKDLKATFDTTMQPEILFKENLLHDDVVVLETKKEDIPGCEVKENIVRSYPYGSLFSHVLGYTAKISSKELEAQANYFVSEQIGKAGVEKSYEQYLRGIPGQIRVKKDSSGKAVGEKEVIPVTKGGNVVLWLNLELQQKLEISLQESLNRLGVQKGAAIAMDPQTGGVLALVSLPGFDPNTFSKTISQKEWDALRQDSRTPLFNRAISGIGFTTGSVIKPLVALGALEKGIITEHTNIFSPLEICVKNKFGGADQCFRDWTFHGDSDVRRAIAESVNPFFYIIGGGYQNQKGLGAQGIKDILQLFGWGQETGIDLPGEGQGILPDLDDNWRLGDTYHFSIGQGSFAVTPIQVATAFSAIANGGTLLQPQMAKEIIDSNEEVVKPFEKHVLRENLLSPYTIEIVREGMRQVVTKGSGTGFLDSVPVQVAAKTGTAQTGRTTSGGRDYLYSWVTTFAPYENPEIVLVIMVEDVVEGEVATLPVARDVLSWYFSR